MAQLEFADRIFLGRNILTMEHDRPRADALAVANGRIVAVGAQTDVLSLRGPRTQVTELRDHALLPGFVDGHGHLASVASSLGFANLAPAPVGTVEDIPGLLAELRKRLPDRQPGEWILGRGYDPAYLVEGRHPTRDDLDRVSGEHPIYISHVSGHLAVANSLALAMAGITESTANPPGGVIQRRTGMSEPNGVLEEAAMGPFNAGLIPPPSTATAHAQLAEAHASTPPLA